MLQQKDKKEKEPSDHGECRTQHASLEFSTCLAEGIRRRCQHAYLFGDGYLCTHPNHRDFTRS